MILFYCAVSAGISDVGGSGGVSDVLAVLEELSVVLFEHPVRTTPKTNNRHRAIANFFM